VRTDAANHLLNLKTAACLQCRPFHFQKLQQQARHHEADALQLAEQLDKADSALARKDNALQVRSAFTHLSLC
jgi:uncharacterized protein YjbK